jgi:hypothetical protein
VWSLWDFYCSSDAVISTSLNTSMYLSLWVAIPLCVCAMYTIKLVPSNTAERDPVGTPTVYVLPFSISLQY